MTEQNLLHLDALPPVPPGERFDHRAFVETLTTRPGVYRMYDQAGKILYVGKAKDLKRRVSSYFSRTHNARTQQLVKQIRQMQITVTHTEAEALILESTLIKQLQPRYNILLRDDKGYPHIFLSAEPFPRLAFHRGSKREAGRYFGPYPNLGSTRETLQLLQKLFPVRQCDPTTFRNRSRPCLHYQMKRCTAPCVGLVSEADYQRDVADAVRFLEGKTHAVIDDLGQRMEAAAAELAFEQAATLRDQIIRLRKIQQRQYVSGERGDLDIVACAVEQQLACIQLFAIRGGRNLGNRAFYPHIPSGEEAAEVIAAFLGQYYLGKAIPREILLTPQVAEAELLEQALTRAAGHPVQLHHRVRKERAHWLALAAENARLALAARLASRAGLAARYQALQSALRLTAPPQRIECFDISHTLGEATVASCVVFNPQGAVKSEYRRFNIDGITPGDDHAAMTQALTRRYQRLQAGEGRVPELLLIDGGKGQLAAAAAALQQLAISAITLVGVAKGEGRKPGREQLFLYGEEQAIILAADSPALHLIQQIRDEAHRFAISGHRKRRAQGRKRSSLEQISGIGATRRQRLLNRFGGLHGVARAGVEELCQVDGINRNLAEKIYQTFHGSD